MLIKIFNDADIFLLRVHLKPLITNSSDKIISMVFVPYPVPVIL